MGTSRQTDPWCAGPFSTLCLSTSMTSRLFIPKPCELPYMYSGILLQLIETAVSINRLQIWNLHHSLPYSNTI